MMDRSIMAPATTMRDELLLLLLALLVLSPISVVLLVVAARNLFACRLPVLGGSSTSTFRRLLDAAGSNKRGIISEEVLRVAPYSRRRIGRRPSSCEEEEEEEDEEEEECVVCLSGIEEGEEIRELKCRHLFHRGCLDRWLLVRPNVASTCPLCRCRLLTPPPGQEEEEEEQEDMLLMLMASLHGQCSWLWPS